VTPLPYSDVSNTTIYGNNIVNGSPGGAALCGAGAGFLGGNDVVYSYTVENTGNIVISMNPQGATNTGIFVYGSCATVGTTCLAGVGNANANVRVIPSLAVTAGQTIYIVISSTTATPNFAYNLSIQNATCPQPTGLDLEITDPQGNLGATIYNAKWDLGSATSWEIAVQPAGEAIPTTPGILTNSNTTNSITTTLTGAPLTAGTSYQYWVRADCGGGLFSAWSGPFLFDTSVCELDLKCNFTFTLTDAGSNGWEGGRMQVIQNGLVVATLGATMTAVPVALCDNIPFELFWSIAGVAPDEVRITVKNSFNQQIYAMTTNSQTLIGTTLYSGTVDCNDPLCLRPTANPTVPAQTIAFNEAIVTWNVAGTSTTTTTSWEIYVVPQGDPAPTAATPAMYSTTGAGPTVSFLITGLPADLQPDTNYTVYVRALCSVNGPSDWTAGTNFRTKEQCPKPTALTVAAATITPFQALLSWTNASQTSWQIIVQFASEPDPAANDPRWIAAPNPSNGGGGPGPIFNQLVTGLTPETAYEFYIRTDCGGGILSNPSGPKAFTTKIACPKPTALLVTPTPFGGTFTWTAAAPATSWQVIVLPAGSPAPLPGDTGIVTDGGGGAGPTYTYTYSGPLLTPETPYVYYVRSDCGINDGLSTWAGPKAFTTTPTCFKPTALSSNNLQAFSVNLTWKSVPTTTAWHVLALPAGSPAPNASSLGWIQITLADVTFTAPDNYSFTYPGLTAETAYSFYIRGNCGDVDGVSTWTGPRNVTTPPSCYKPSALTATSITAFGAQLGWTNNPLSPVTEWQLYIVPQGSPAPAVGTTGTIITNTPPLLTDLTPYTCYDYYVRSSCGGVNGLSTWAGPFNFCTLPTCPQPTGLNSESTPDANVNLLSWDEPGTATQWQIIVQAPSGPIPGPNTIPTATTTVEEYLTGTLDPGFYEFYVRSVCSDIDKSFWTGPFNFFVTVPPAVCASVDISVATTSPGVIDLCPGENCVDLAAEFTDSKDTTTYTVLPVAFAPPFPFTGGTQLNISIDDTWGSVFTLPFNFCFYGVNYPTVQVGSNGVLTFNTPQPTGAGTCPWNTEPGEVIPDPGFPILNAIYGVYQDIDPSEDTAPIARSINYQVLGVAPCRAFVVNFYNIGQFQCGTDVGLQTSQIVLYETSNIIEVYVQDRTVCGWNDGLGVIGIQNQAGTFAHFPPGRNLGNWEAHNEAWRFTPDGASNVVFSWLKDGAFYSNDPVINVCVSETTNMTAQAVYEGCGGQIATKTEDVLLRINELVIPPIQNVVACQSYTLPALTTGSYFSQPGGIGPIDPLVPITTAGINTIYVFATTATTPPCDFEISFTVEIVEQLIAPQLTPVSSCDTYVLPILSIPFNYYTGPGGTGTMYTGLGGDTISTSQQLYIYGVSGTCTAESTLDITIDTLQLATQSNLTDCNNITLPALPVNNSYYTATGGPNGTGALIPDLTVLDETQTVYIYAQSGTCSEEGNFTVTINGIDPPTLNITDPTCAVPTATIDVVTPAPGAILPTDLYISEVTDAATGSLTYVEIFNGTAAPIDLSNYKLKFYTHGAPPNNAAETLSCNLTLSGMIASNATNVIKVSNSAAQPTVVAQQTFTGCGGVNNNDNIRLTTIADVEVDVFGRIDGTIYTPGGATGYTYRRNTNAVVPSTTWIPADWSEIDPEDYTEVGSYTQVVAFTYQYNIDGGPWQFGTTFTNVAIGQHTITAQDIATGCTGSITVDIAPEFTSTPVTTIKYNSATVTSVCNNASNISPDTSEPGFVSGGVYSALPNTLVINAGTGEVDIVNSPAGEYVITYAVAVDLINCIGPGSSSVTLTIKPILTPDFATTLTFCEGTVAPTLELTSPNEVEGTWLPATIDNTVDGTYEFTPNPGQCANNLTISVDVTPPTIVPDFATPLTFCSGTVAPLLGATSPNGITGTWLPATIDNTADGTYVFTPDAGQCAIAQTLTTVVTAPNVDPAFAAIQPFCAGDTAPLLATTSPVGITGTWSPATIDNTADGTYIFTPNAGQCAISNTLNVTVSPSLASDFVAIPTICSGGTIPTLATTSPNGIVGSWSPSAIDPSVSGMYTFTPDAAIDPCAVGQVLEVTIAANPVFNVIGGCINGDYTLTVTSTSDLETASFIWKNAAGTVIGGNTSSIVVTQTGDYTCEVTYQGCSASDIFPATTISCTIQKGISPKGTGAGDGLNDYFDLEGQNVTKLEIFNRYGTIVYSKSNYSKEWYGQSDNGDELPDGTYFYVIERNGETSRTGWIYINHEL
jgi:gliding motility-associated-like protein